MLYYDIILYNIILYYIIYAICVVIYYIYHIYNVYFVYIIYLNINCVRFRLFFCGVQRNCGSLRHLTMCCIPQKFIRFRGPLIFFSFK